MIQNIRHAAKAVLRGKFIATEAHIKKHEKPQINSLTIQVKQLGKEKQRKHNVS